ncbi:MAG: DUF1667 domain-containing protein [Oscillospiraceae bacterium]
MREFICIVCPNGCRLRAEQSADGTCIISGNTCRRGELFGINEVTNPTRSLTTTVRTAFTDYPVLPVRTNGEIPKGMMMSAMKQINKVIVKEPVKCNDIIIENLLNTGIDVIATSSVEKERQTQY